MIEAIIRTVIGQFLLLGGFRLLGLIPAFTELKPRHFIALCCLSVGITFISASASGIMSGRLGKE